MFGFAFLGFYFFGETASLFAGYFLLDLLLFFDYSLAFDYFGYLFLDVLSFFFFKMPTYLIWDLLLGLLADRMELIKLLFWLYFDKYLFLVKLSWSLLVLRYRLETPLLLKLAWLWLSLDLFFKLSLILSSYFCLASIILFSTICTASSLSLCFLQKS